MSSSQKALFVEKFPGPLVLKDRAVPQPKAGELQVKIQAAALNPMDWKIADHPFFIAQLFPDAPKEEQPLVFGTDFAGEVTAVGSGVTAFKVGDKISSVGSLGADDTQAFQQYATIPAKFAAKLPGNVSVEEASTLSIAYTTAAMGLYLGGELTAPWDGGKGKYAGKPIVVLGGSSSVGQFVIQLAKLSGFSPIITTSSAAHESTLKSFGATHVVGRSASAAEVQKLAGGPVDFVYDAIAAPETQTFAAEVASNGAKVVVTGPPSFDAKLKGLTPVTVFACVYMSHNSAFGEKLYAALPALLADGSIKPSKVELLPGGLNAVSDGLDRLRANKVSGVKLVVAP